MTESTTAGLCRLTVRAPDRRFDIAVPVDVPIAELLPTLVEHAGAELDDTGDHGWLLQRLGDTPLDPEQDAVGLGLRDGEVLHLRPGRDRLPPLHFDDLVDGIATGMRDRPDAWRPAFTHHLLLGLAMAALGAVFAMTALHGPLTARLPVTLTLAILLLTGATLASRALGDGGAGAALGLAAMPFLAAFGALIPQGPGGDTLLGARLLAGGAAGTGAAVLALAGVAACVPLLLGAATVSFACALGGLFMVTVGRGPAQTAALMAIVVVVFGAFVPSLAFRLAGFRLPPLPTNSEQLQEGIEPHPGRAVLDRTAVSDQYMTGLYAATGIVCATCLTPLAVSGSGLRQGIAAVLSLLLFLHARALGSAWQRLAMVLPAAYGVVLLAVTAEGLTRGVATGGLLVAIAALIVAAWSLPGRRPLPYWGRAADLLHSLVAVALVPLVLWDLGVYSALRGVLG